MSVAVSKRFDDVYEQAGMDRASGRPIQMPTLNNFHQERYNDFFSSGSVSSGKPVVDIYKHAGFDDPTMYKTSMRGMDDREKMKTLNSIVRKITNTSELAQRPFQ